MNSTQTPDARRPASAATAEEIEQDIERTRAQLGDTADALAYKLDPRVQAKQKLQEARNRPTLVIAVATTAVAVVVLGVVLRRRNS